MTYFRYFNSRLDILYTFIPQMIFLSSIFIYLCLEVIAKWLYFSVSPGWVLGYYFPGSNCAPSLLVGLINMFMMKSRNKGFVEGNVEGGKTFPLCHLSYWYPGQVGLSPSTQRYLGVPGLVFNFFGDML